MGMPRSPHRKHRAPLTPSYRAGKAGGWGLWMPLGHRAGHGHKAQGGNEPGKRFKDPQGTVHVVPKRGKGNRD